MKQVFVEACAARNSKSFTEAMKQVRAPELDLVAHLGRLTCVPAGALFCSWCVSDCASLGVSDCACWCVFVQRLQQLYEIPYFTKVLEEEKQRQRLAAARRLAAMNGGVLPTGVPGMLGVSGTTPAVDGAGTPASLGSLQPSPMLPSGTATPVASAAAVAAVSTVSVPAAPTDGDGGAAAGSGGGGGDGDVVMAGSAPHMNGTSS